MTLISLHKNTDGEVSLKRLALTQQAETDVKQLFSRQKNAFFKECEIIPFDGNWKPEEDEIFDLNLTENNQVNQIEAIFNQNEIAIDLFNINEIDNLKGFCLKDSEGDILFQRFQTWQYLKRSVLGLVLYENTFDSLTSSTLSFDNKILCILRKGHLFFKSYTSVRPLLSLKQYYEEATNNDVEDFSRKLVLSEEGKVVLLNNLNQTIRKRIQSIISKGVLERYSLDQIKAAAEQEHLDNIVSINNQKIEIPNDKKKILALLSFLDEKLYKGWDSKDTLITNSSKTIE